MFMVESSLSFIHLASILEYLKNNSKIFNLSGILFGADDYLVSIGYF